MYNLGAIVFTYRSLQGVKTTDDFDLSGLSSRTAKPQGVSSVSSFTKSCSAALNGRHPDTRPLSRGCV